tara:strand:+ start:682 stop:879 length:198 start_codon:yes stop_codon:yes gene_type:complete
MVILEMYTPCIILDYSAPSLAVAEIFTVSINIESESGMTWMVLGNNIFGQNMNKQHIGTLRFRVP